MKDGTAEFDIKKVASTESVNSKQDAIEDTGWIEVTDIGSNFTVRASWYKPVVRRIGKQLFFKGQFDNKKHTSNGIREQNTVCRMPQGFRPPYEVTVDEAHGSWIDTEGYLLWAAVYPDLEWVQINTSWLAD